MLFAESREKLENQVELCNPKTKSSAKGQPLHDLDERDDVVLIDELPPEPERAPKARSKRHLQPIGESHSKANPFGNYTTFCSGYFLTLYFYKVSFLFLTGTYELSHQNCVASTSGTRNSVFSQAQGM